MNDLFDLCLSHWQAKDQVFVPAEVVKKLKAHHYDPIRFLYNCYKSNLGGAILSQSEGMNFSIQIAAFLRALKAILKGTVLVLALQEQLGYWYYHLVEQGKWKVRLELQMEHAEESCIILLPLSDDSKLKSLSNYEFTMVIIDGFEKVAKKTAIRKLTGQFRIGLTHRNFTKCPDQRLQWMMLRWTNPKHFGTFESFCETDNEHFERFTEPFTQFWQRRSWNFSNSFKKDTKEEVEIYQTVIRKWLKEMNLKFLDISEAVAPKRKSNEKESKKGKRKVIKRSSSTNNDRQEFEKTSNHTNSPKELPAEILNDGNQTNSSSDTIIYEPDDLLDEKPVCHQLPSMEVSPIVQSIADSFCRSPIKQERRRSDEILSFLFDNSSSNFKSEVEVVENTPIYCDKETILSELFN